MISSTDKQQAECIYHNILTGSIRASRKCARISTGISRSKLLYSCGSRSSLLNIYLLRHKSQARPLHFSDLAYLTALQENLELYRRVQQEENYDRIMEVDNEFHRLIFVSVNKSWIYTRLKAQMVHFDRLRMLSMSSIAGKTSDTLKEHEDILYAITRHDGEMAEMMDTRHLSHSLGEIDGVMKQYPDYICSTQGRHSVRLQKQTVIASRIRPASG